MIFQPTNINPDIKGGLGYGTRDLTQGLTVEWVVNGNSPLLAFSITIYANDANSTLLYTTGQVTDDCPFYPVNYAGEQQAMSYFIDAATLAGANIVNGSEYKLIIAQWYGVGGSDYVEQSSASVFVGKADPTLTIDAIPAPLIARSYTFTATYAQAQGDALNWVRWQIASADDQSNPFYDTGNIYGTAQLQVSYDGFFTGNTYSIQCSAQTVSGVDVTTGWVDFDVDYPQTAIEGAASAVCVKGKNAVKVSFSPLSSIVGTGTGTYSFADGQLTLASGAKVVWDTVNGEAMNFNSPWSMILKCNPNGTTTTRNFCELITDTFAVTDPDFGDVLERYRIGMRFYSSTSLSVIVFLDYSTDDGATWSIMANNNIIAQFTGSIGSSDATYLVTPTTAYIRCNTQTAEKQMSGTYWEDAITRPIQSVTILGVGIVDYLQIFDGNGASAYVQGAITDGTYTPIYDTNTIFLASFDNADLSAGNIATDANIEDIAIYRKGANETTLTHVANAQLGDTYVYDYGAQSQQGDYTYYVVPRATEISTKSTSGNPIATFEGDGLPFTSIKANIVATQDLNGEASPWIGDAETTPYLFREAGGGATVGNSEFDSIVGGTVAWNQLNNLNDVRIPSSSTDALSITNNGDGSVTITGTISDSTKYAYLYDNGMQVTGHKYLLRTGSFMNDSLRVYIGASGYYIQNNNYKFIEGDSSRGLTIRVLGNPNFYAGAVNATIFATLHDLTQMFGTTIADYIYTLESGTAGAGVAWLKAHGYFTKDYYAYDAGSLQSVCAASHVIGGSRNLYNPVEKTASSSNTFLVLNVVPNTDYTFSVDVSQSGLYAQEDEDGDGTWITFASLYNVTVLTFNSGNHTRIRVMTYSSANTLPTQWQLEFGTTATAYTPYVAPTIYSLDGSLTLRGVPKLDANNKLYYDGDKYTADGSVARNWREVTLDGTENWVVASTDSTIYQTTLPVASDSDWKNLVCSNFIAANIYAGGTAVGMGHWSAQLYVRDQSRFPTLADFTTYLAAQNTAGTPVKFCYKVATATTETADPFTARQEVTAGGTEEYFDGNVWGCVDLGTLTWTYASSSGRSIFTTHDLAGIYKPSGSNSVACNVLFERYNNVPISKTFVNLDAGLDGSTSSRIVICDNSYTDAATFKAAMSGVYLIYELATQPRAFSLPVGHSTNYANYCPISGETGTTVTRAGRNMLVPIVSGGSITWNGVTLSAQNGELYLNGTASASGGRTTLKTSNFTLPRGTYTISCSKAQLVIHNASDNSIIANTLGVATFTLDQPTAVYAGFNVVANQSYSGTLDAQIELGSTATAYKPYAGEVFSVSWADSAGTVFGGYYDFVSGTLTATWVKDVLDGTHGTWVDYAGREGIMVAIQSYFPTTPVDLRPKYSTIFALDNRRCTVLANSPQAYDKNRTAAFNFSTAGSYRNIYLYLWGGVPDAAAAKAFFKANPTEFIYELENPQTFQLPPQAIDTLEGTNNVWDDIGTVDTEYEIYTEQPAPLITNPLCVSWWMWTVLECTQDANGFYQVLNAYNFRNNLTSGKISNNNSPNVALNFTKYPTVQTVPQNFKSGALQSLIGAVTLNTNTGAMEYADSLALRDSIYNLSTTTNPLFLKNTKGDLLKIKINGAIEMETSDNTRELMQTMELPWVEVGSTKGISIIGY